MHRTDSSLGGSAARRLGGSAARRLGGSAARRLGGSAARRLGGSAARRLGGSAARRLGGSAARRLGEHYRPSPFSDCQLPERTLLRRTHWARRRALTNPVPARQSAHGRVHPSKATLGPWYARTHAGGDSRASLSRHLTPIPNAAPPCIRGRLIAPVPVERHSRVGLPVEPGLVRSDPPVRFRHRPFPPAFGRPSCRDAMMLLGQRLRPRCPAPAIAPGAPGLCPASRRRLESDRAGRPPVVTKVPVARRRSPSPGCAPSPDLPIALESARFVRAHISMASHRLPATPGHSATMRSSAAACPGQLVKASLMAVSGPFTSM